ncbi:MAG: SsrA-binding protein SmpB [Deltaproteobacteria bacterium]|nr:SsrA-binding protein SmpB [Deltaproteobacteria bacterium]
MSNKGTPGAIATNRKALHDYSVDDTIEAGIMLVGSEVKSIRAGRVTLKDSYAAFDERGECLLHQLHINEYPNATHFQHVPLRVRKLLLHKEELEKLQRKVSEKGYTLIPLELYLKNRRIKVKLGLCRGKKEYDKRQSIKERDEDRDRRRGE